MTLVRINLFSLSRLWTTCTKFDNCQRCEASYGKKLYRCTSTFPALNYCSGIFFRSLSYLYEVVHRNFPSIFGLFAIFGRNFAKIVAPPSDEYENYVVHPKEQSLLKEVLNLVEIGL